jgi:hypothetical protein
MSYQVEIWRDGWRRRDQRYLAFISEVARPGLCVNGMKPRVTGRAKLVETVPCESKDDAEWTLEAVRRSLSVDALAVEERLGRFYAAVSRCRAYGVGMKPILKVSHTMDKSSAQCVLAAEDLAYRLESWARDMQILSPTGRRLIRMDRRARRYRELSGDGGKGGV